MPPLAGWNRLTGVQGGGVSELRSIAHGRVDIDHAPFADEHVLAERYRTDLDPPGVIPIAVEDADVLRGGFRVHDAYESQSQVAHCSPRP